MMSRVLKNKIWIIILVIQAFVVVLGFGMLRNVEKNLKEETYSKDVVVIGEGRQQWAPESALSLKRGSYEIDILYTTENETTCQAFMQTSYGDDYGDTVVLLKEANKKTFDMMLYRNVTEFYLVSSEATLNVDKIVVRETAQWSHMLYTLCILFMMLVDLFIWQKQHQSWENLTIEKKNAFVAVMTIGMLSSLPLFTNYLLNGADLSFHLMRIEGIAEGLRNGDFPVKMQPLWINDYGYPVSVMYGDLLLYVPALLRLAGFTLQTAYKVYLIGINVLTAFTSYQCGKKLSGNYKIGIVLSLLYTLSGYRLTNEIQRAAIGEVTAMVFMPIVFLGLWQLFSTEEKEKDRQSAMLLIIGYTGILESHLLSFAMVIWFSLFYCLVNGKKFIKRLRLLLVTAVVTIGVNLYYLVPMLDYMRREDMHVFHTQDIGMQSRGLFFPQLFQMFAVVTSKSFGYMAPVFYGIGDELIMSAGFPFAIVIGLYVWEHLAYKKKIVEEYGVGERKDARRILWMVLLSAWMSLYVFPWSILEENSQFGTILAPYQFPMRFTVAVMTFGLMLGAYALKYLKTVWGGIIAKVLSSVFVW
jgi:hypothetical protein